MGLIGLLLGYLIIALALPLVIASNLFHIQLGWPEPKPLHLYGTALGWGLGGWVGFFVGLYRGWNKSSKNATWFPYDS